jgi:hypothetical protein
MIKLITTTAAIIAVSIPSNAFAASSQPKRVDYPQQLVTTPGLTQAVDQWANDIKVALQAFRNVNKDWEEKVLEFDAIIAKLAACAHKVRPGSELDQEVQGTISLCLQRADETLKLASDPENDEDIAAGYRFAEKKFRSQAEQIRVILRSIHEMHTHFVKYQGKVSKYRKYYVVMMTAQETDKAIKALSNVENDMKNVLSMLDELKAKPAEIVAIRDGNKVAVNTK